MSGGSYDYVFGRIRDFADDLRGQHDDPLRAAFAKHLRLVSEAAFQVEWVDSGDKGEGDEVEAIRAVLGPAAELEAAIEMAEKARDRLDESIARARRVRRATQLAKGDE